ncbi:MAG: hypothetical protein QM495_07675 [Lutibacter sp.]|uniref:hypothetical protein n=1 Tax=Lutibacter sp. TaxID=1925666 RepID=UPI00385E92DB
MQFFKKIVDFYIFSNIHVALAGFCLTKITLIKFGNENNLTPLFVALSIIISYNFIRFFEIKYKRLQWFKKWFFNHKRSLLLLVVLSIVLLGYITFFYSFNLKAVVILFPFAFMTLFYVVPLFKIKNNEFSFRNFPSIKIFSIAIAWAGITVFFPLYERGSEFTSEILIVFFQRLLILISITLPFDIRDVNIDSKQLKTLPQLFGVNSSKIIGYVLLLIVIFLENMKENNIVTYNYILVIIAVIIGMFLTFSSPKRSRYYTSFWVEAIPIFWYGLIVLFLNS